ncbi:YSIRK-type signal peptide-containing protein, partial [Mammaliicoccus lentus]|uniref:YSIRK-type signal peptide-containing protein n=1 Tax=Mammaliicoccus lentus TaxID=42858 RepID=UPI0012905DE9
MDKQRRLQKFSIRKYAVGTCSILIGTLIFLGSPADHAFASENTLDVAKQEESAKEKEEKEINKTVEEADKSSEENKQQNEETSTNQPTTEDIVEQSKFEETDKQQVEEEKSVATEETVKPEESLINEDAADKQESTVKEEKVEEVEKPKTKEVAVKETKAENPAIKEEQPKNDTVKSEDKSDEKSQKETEKSEDKLVEKENNNKNDVVVEQPATTENKQVSDEVVQPEIKENTQSEKKTTETEEKPVKSDTPDKAGIVTEQPREERRSRSRRDLRSADHSPLRARTTTEERSQNSGSFNKAFGRNAHDIDVPNFVSIEHISQVEKGNNVQFNYVIHFNKGQTPDARGRFYFFAPSGVTLTPGSVERLSGNGSKQKWINQAVVTGGSKLNSMVYQAMSQGDRDYYKNLTKITDEDNFYYIHEQLNHRRNSYIAKMTATVSKDWLRRHGGKFYIATGTATENIGVNFRHNHVRFVENRYEASDNNSINTNDRFRPLSLKELYNISWKSPHLANRPDDPGFELSPDGKTLIYKYAIGQRPNHNLNTDELLELLVATPKSNNGRTLDGGDKKKAENRILGFSMVGINNGDREGDYLHNGKNVPVLDIIQPVGGDNGKHLIGGRVINIEGSAEGQDGVTNKNKYNRVVSGFEIDAAHNNGAGSASFSDPRIIRGAEGTNDIAKDNSAGAGGRNINEGKNRAINKFQLYASLKSLSYLHNLNPDTTRDAINFFVVPVDVTKPRVLEQETKAAITVPNRFNSKEELRQFIENNVSKIVGKDNFSTSDHLVKTLKVYDQNDNEISLNSDAPIESGTYKIKAIVTDEASNISDPVELSSAVVTEKPSQPVIQSDLTNKAEKPGTQDPIIVASQPGATVYLFNKDNSLIGKAVADGNGNATITPTKPIPEGNVIAIATFRVDNLQPEDFSIPSNPKKATDTTAPAKPVIQTDLTGKAGKKEPITVQAEPKSKVELFDKDGNKIGEGTANDQGQAVITPTKPLPEGNVTAKATDKAETPNTSVPSDPKKATDTTAPAKP